MRAEPWFLTSLSRNPFLQPYIADSLENFNILIARNESIHMETNGLVKTLGAIYLDTEAMLSSSTIPSKVSHALSITSSSRRGILYF